MFNLTGKMALVTGASGGIGGAIARALAGAGATLALSGTRAEPLEALRAELGEKHHVLLCDLSKPEEVETLVQRSEAVLGDLDILVNNAGITRDALFIRISDADWQAVLNVNLTSVFQLSRAAVRGMLRRRRRRS